MVPLHVKMMEWAVQKGIILEWRFPSVRLASFSRLSRARLLLSASCSVEAGSTSIAVPASSSRTEFTDPSTPRLKPWSLLEKSEKGNMEQETFPSLTVDINSPTPYKDATQVEPC